MLKCLVQAALFVLLAAIVLLPDVTLACPTCKDNLAPDGQLTGMARGYAYSILFMLSMPPLIFGGLSAYFYWEVRKARRAQEAAASGHAPTPIAGGVA
jgi:hypothetical protein